jgi:hypothetical protein
MLFCKRCETRFTIASISDDFASHIDKLMTAGQNVSAIQDIRNTLGCGLQEAMLIFHHLQIIPGRCNHCRASIPDDEFVNCASCAELNINVHRVR